LIKITDVNGISKENSMNRIKTHLSIILTATLLGVLNPGDAYGTSPVDWVDPLIDTHASRWFYFNSASRPFGMVNLSPDTQTKGSWESGYLYGDKKIRCFSHIHAWQLSGIPVMPIAGEMTGHQGMDVYQSEFSHEDESVQVGYHKVHLKKYGITAELTSTVRTGFHRYSYPTTEKAYVLFDLGAYLGHSPTVRSEIHKVSDTEIAGMSVMKSTMRRRKDTPVFFVARFSGPMASFGGWEASALKSGTDHLSGADTGAFVRFQTVEDEPVLMKVGISYTSIEGARRNLDQELPHWDFDRVVRESSEEWNQHLSRIKVEGGSEARKTKFYTDLWRSMLGRRIVSDVDGAYSDMTGDERVIRHIPNGKDGLPAFNMHNFDAWWGSHWSLNILWPLLCPDRYSDFCNTSVQMYKNGGLIPRGPSGGNYTFVMIGDTAAPFITSAYAKGIRDFDCEAALEGLVKNTEADGGRYYGGYAKNPAPAVYKEYQEKGWVSLGNDLEKSHGDAVTSFTLYNAYHDWCIAQMAKGLQRDEVYRRFIPGARNYRHVIWPEKQSAWVKMPDGSWAENYRPREKVFEQKGFCETSAAVTTFYVPHDPMGLAEMLGGPAAAAKKLNEQFEAAVVDKFHLRGRIHGNAWIDYANQDGTGAAHYFNRIGHPWLSQKWVRAVLDAAFSGTNPYSGYNGDEDQGQMGAVSALMALGLFQFDGGSGLEPQYEITAPVFDKVTIQLSRDYYGGNTVTIIANNQCEENIYIQSATWNGKSLDSCRLPHKDLIQGGQLVLNLGAAPNKEWGVHE
jgi:predicted alpha-1,2-mannosidase